MLNLVSAKVCILDHYRENGDSVWLEGWICGYTDPDHEYDQQLKDTIHSQLFDYLQELRDNVKEIQRRK